MKSIKFFLLCFVTISVSAFAKDSLEFGLAGIHSASELQVFIDSTEPAPRCARCVYFSILIDDRGAIGGTVIDEIKVKVRHPRAEKLGLFKPKLITLQDFKTLYPKHYGSRVVSKSIANTLPATPPLLVNDFEFEISAVKYKCQNFQVPECKDRITSVNGKFRGDDVVHLKKIDPKKLVDFHPVQN